jgi:hypothetical protein
MTGRDLITAALKKIGALAPGESLDAEEATDGLSELNRMLGSWSNSSLLVHSRVRESLSLTASDGSYTMGSSGDLNTTRPVAIEQAAISDGTAETPVRLLSLAEWQSIGTKDVDGLPDSLFDDGGYPLRTLRLYPRPGSSSYSLVLWSLKPLTSISTLDTSISLPPGYEDALVYNLALRLAPEYGKQASVELVQAAIDSKADLKRANHRPRYLQCDPAITPTGGFNIVTGGSA